MNENLHIDPIVTKYIQEEVLGPEENLVLSAWVAENPERLELLNKLRDDPAWTKENLLQLRDLPNDRIWQKFEARMIAEGYWQFDYENPVITEYVKAELVLEETNTDMEPSKIITDARVIQTALFELIKKDPRHMHKMTDREFEFLVAEIFEKMKYSVEVTGQTRDWGKDIIAVKHNEFGRMVFYVECKRYGFTRHVGVEVVQRLQGAISGKATGGVIVTSSDFSAPAKQYTRTIEHQMSLVNYAKLCEWIKELNR